MKPTRQDAGFTLIELILVLLLTAALAVTALPKIVDLGLWRLRAFGDDMQARHQAMLRLALQQRRPIVATITAANVTYTDGVTVLHTLNCPASASPCIAEGGTRTVTFNAANSGSTHTSTGSAMTVTVSYADYSQAYRVEHETGLIYALP